MKTLLQKVSFRWDIISGRYKFLIAKEKEDIEACIAILEEVRRKELNRVSGNSVLDSHSFSGKDLNYKLTACRDSKTGEIIGCIRITDAFQAKDVPSSKMEYKLDQFPDELLKKLKICTRLAVLKPYRKTPAALVLIARSFKNILDEGGQAALISCEPSLFTMYKRIGFRPIGPPNNSASGGYRIPMIFIPDLEYMKKIKSPGVHLAKEMNFSKYEPIRQWYKQFEQEHGKIELGVSQYRDEDRFSRVDHIITKGLSEEGRKYFLKNAMAIKCKVDDVIVAEQDGGKAMGIVKKGIVKVVIDGRIVVLLGKGDIFGEIAFVLNSKRTATLMAADPKTEVILFSVSAIKRLESNDDKITVWQNLAKVLAQRLVQQTRV